MNEKYIPMHSLFHDDLENISSRAMAAKVVFRKNGGKAVIHGKITRLYDEDGVEFLEMDSGLTISLDDLIEVNGKQSSGYC